MVQAVQRLRFVAAIIVLAWVCATAAAQAACPSNQDREPQSIAGLTLLGTTEVRRTPDSASEHLGGISGLEYDLEKNLWYLLSDDRSQWAPARFYPAKIAFDGAHFGAVTVLPPVTLPVPATEVPDPEALRLIPCTKLLAWSSEGDREHGYHPSVRLITTDGLPMGELSLPENLRFSADGKTGARENLSLEGLAPTRDGKSLWVAMEAPLIQDGAVSGLTRGAKVRFTRLPLDGGKAMQFAYPIDAIPVAASGGLQRADNGVSEILVLGDESLLVIERSGREMAPNEFAFDIRVYQASVSQADNVIRRHTLDADDVKTMKKKLITNLKDLGLPWIDNIEGAAWGPRLADGRASLVLISDDNFARNQVTQMIFFAVEPP